MSKSCKLRDHISNQDVEGLVDCERIDEVSKLLKSTTMMTPIAVGLHQRPHVLRAVGVGDPCDQRLSLHHRAHAYGGVELEELVRNVRPIVT